MDAQYRNLFEQTYASSTRDAVDAYYDFSTAIGSVTLTTAAPTGNSLAANLVTIARIIGAQSQFAAKRQIFFVQLGGWDHHDEVIAHQQTMLATVSQALATFWAALGETKMQDKVTLFTASDFGRTLTSNGNGSDHAWGGNHLVLGGAVGGGKVYGNRDQNYYPDLRNLAQIDTGQGRLIPGVAVDEYARDLLTWFGVKASDLDYVLPAFSDRFGGRPELGLFTPAPITPPPPVTPTPTPTPAGGSSSGGGVMDGMFAGSLGLLYLLHKRRQRLAAKSAAAKVPAEKQARAGESGKVR